MSFPITQRVPSRHAFIFYILASFLLFFAVSGETTTTLTPADDVTPTTHAPKQIAFHIDTPAVVQLPSEGIELAVVFDELPTANSALPASSVWSFYWNVLEGQVYAESYDRQKLKLTKLGPGTLRVQVSVSNSTNSESEVAVVKIEPPRKANAPPKAVIKPESPVTIFDHSQLILNGEGSHDEDGRILSFEWHLKKGPALQVSPAMNVPILTLPSLEVGNYTFGLKVADDNGETAEAEVDVFVKEARDDPPKAKITRCGDEATGTITVRLPVDELFLCGNSSSDDVGIENYQWGRMDNTNLPIDFVGSSTPVLKLANLKPNDQLGPYVFQLSVYDRKKQNDTTNISIFVNKALNQAPKVDAGKNMTIYLPESTAVLEGQVEDDGTIVRYEWTQLEGPTQAVVVNNDKAKATATQLVEGSYAFRFTVVDDGGLNATAIIGLKVERSKNEHPVARAPDVAVVLPKTIAILNASTSTDDAGVVAFKWTPLEDVPACIRALDDSDSSPVMFVTGLVEGEFSFNLTVWDQQKEANWTIVQLKVSSGVENINAVELFMNLHITEATYKLRSKLGARLSAALTAQIHDATDVVVHFTDFALDPRTGHFRVVFYADFYISEGIRKARNDAPTSTKTTIEARKAVDILQKEAIMIEEFRIVQIDTLYCRRKCSGHGRCNNFTKECECESYWMASFFTILSTGKHQDCAWSKLYVIIATFTLASFGILLVLGCSTRKRSRRSGWCCCLEDVFGSWFATTSDRLSRRRRYRRRQKYEKLDTETKISMSALSCTNSDSDDSLFNAKRPKPPPVTLHDD